MAATPLLEEGETPGTTRRTSELARRPTVVCPWHDQDDRPTVVLGGSGPRLQAKKQAKFAELTKSARGLAKTPLAEPPLAGDAIRDGVSTVAAAGDTPEPLDQPEQIKREASSQIFPAVGKFGVSNAQSWENMIPHWAANKGVFKNAMKLREIGIHEPIPLQCAVGPAVPMAFWAWNLAWLLFLIVPWPAYEFSHCGEGHIMAVNNTLNSTNEPNESDGGFHIAAVRSPAAFFLLLSPAILILLWIEWQCFRYYIIPQVQVTGGFKLFGFSVGFKKWLPVAFIMSAVSHADLITNGVFLATTWKTTTCDHKVERVWSSVMHQGLLFQTIPGLNGVADVPFWKWVTALWIMMAFQAVYGLLGALPLHKIYHYVLKHLPFGIRIYKWFEETYEWWPHGITQRVKWEPQSQCYMTLSDLFQIANASGVENPEQVSQKWWDDAPPFPGFPRFLHEVANYNDAPFEFVRDFIWGSDGFGTTYQTFFSDCAKSNGDHGTALLSLADSTRMSMITSAKVEYSKQKTKFYLKTGKHGPAFGITKRVLQSAVHQVVLAGILQSGFQVNLQCSLLAMTSFLGDSMNWQMFFSVFVGTCVMVRNFVEAVQLWFWVRSVLTSPDKGGIRDIQGSPFRSILKYKFGVFTFAMVIYAFLAFYVLAKFAGLFICDDRVLNMNGCAKNLPF